MRFWDFVWQKTARLVVASSDKLWIKRAMNNIADRTNRNPILYLNRSMSQVERAGDHILLKIINVANILTWRGNRNAIGMVWDGCGSWFFVCFENYFIGKTITINENSKQNMYKYFWHHFETALFWKRSKNKLNFFIKHSTSSPASEQGVSESLPVKGPINSNYTSMPSFFELEIKSSNIDDCPRNKAF